MQFLDWILIIFESVLASLVVTASLFFPEILIGAHTSLKEYIYDANKNLDMKFVAGLLFGNFFVAFLCFMFGIIVEQYYHAG